MDLHIQFHEHAGYIIATTPEIPGCQGIGSTTAAAARRLKRAVYAYTERGPPSPFASVRKRLGERQGFQV